MGRNQLGKDARKANLGVEIGDGTVLPWEQGGKGMQVVVVDLVDIGIGHDDEGQVSKSLNAFG